jgi:hypothetical protein
MSNIHDTERTSDTTGTVNKMVPPNGVEEGETPRLVSLSNGGLDASASSLTPDHTTAPLVASALLKARIAQPILPP